MADTAALSQEIDQLIEQYLGLLDQYTILREQLSTSQSSIQQSLARANFTAERGVRYGRDCYDERMQASRTCSITPDGAFSISNTSLQAESNESEDTAGLAEAEKSQSTTTSKTTNGVKRKDPIRMFGILTPQALRTAQGEAVKMVEGIIPQLVQVGREMEALEIEVRRRRKWLVKAEGKSRSLVEKGGLVEGETGEPRGMQINGVACGAD